MNTYFSGGQCALHLCSSNPFILYKGPLADAVLSLGQTPTILSQGALGPPPPKKFSPNFSKLLGDTVKILIAL